MDHIAQNWKFVFYPFAGQPSEIVKSDLEDTSITVPPKLLALSYRSEQRAQNATDGNAATATNFFAALPTISV